MTEPTRRLIGHKPHRYVPASHTDVRRTWRKARLLAHLKRIKQQQGENECASSSSAK